MFFIQRLRRPFFSTYRGHHEPRVLSLFQVFGLGHHPPRAAPTLPRLIDELFEQPGRATGLLVLGFRLLPLLLTAGVVRLDGRDISVLDAGFTGTVRDWKRLVGL